MSRQEQLHMQHVQGFEIKVRSLRQRHDTLIYKFMEYLGSLYPYLPAAELTTLSRQANSYQHKWKPLLDKIRNQASPKTVEAALDKYRAAVREYATAPRVPVPAALRDVDQDAVIAEEIMMKRMFAARKAFEEAFEETLACQAEAVKSMGLPRGTLRFVPYLRH